MLLCVGTLYTFICSSVCLRMSVFFKCLVCAFRLKTSSRGKIRETISFILVFFFVHIHLIIRIYIIPKTYNNILLIALYFPNSIRRNIYHIILYTKHTISNI